MIHLPFATLQSALHARLTTDWVGLKVFTLPPTVNEALPYVILTSFSATEINPQWEVTVSIDIYSQTAGNAEINILCGNVLKSISRDQLNLSGGGFRHEETFLDSVQTAIESGDERGPVQHGTIRMRMVVSDIAGGSWN